MLYYKEGSGLEPIVIPLTIPANVALEGESEILVESISLVASRFESVYDAGLEFEIDEEYWELDEDSLEITWFPDETITYGRYALEVWVYVVGEVSPLKLPKRGKLQLNVERSLLLEEEEE